jgi:hypothetical protein
LKNWIHFAFAASISAFRPTRSLYTLARFTTEGDIADFGPVSPDPVIQHGSRSSGNGVYDSAEVLAMAFRSRWR